MRLFPTLRLDYNLTSAHRLTFSTRYNDFSSVPDFLNNADPRFPGFPNFAGQTSGRYMWQGTLRSTFGKSVVNEFRVGGSDATGLGTYFGEGVDESQFNCSGLGCQSAGGIGWNFAFPGIGASGLTSATAYNGPNSSVAAQWSVENNMTWLKGAHSISVGGNFARISDRRWNDDAHLRHADVRHVVARHGGVQHAGSDLRATSRAGSTRRRRATRATCTGSSRAA